MPCHNEGGKLELEFKGEMTVAQHNTSAGHPVLHMHNFFHRSLHRQSHPTTRILPAKSSVNDHLSSAVSAARCASCTYRCLASIIAMFPSTVAVENDHFATRSVAKCFSAELR